MTLRAKFKGIDWPVTQCGQFLSDDNFLALRDLFYEGKKLPTVVERVVYPKSDTSIKKIKTTMDNVTFHQDRFEVIIDARGFSPEDLSCMVTPNLIMIRGEAQNGEQTSMNSGIQRNLSINRNYQLPQKINPHQGNCYLSSEGLLVVSAPWMK